MSKGLQTLQKKSPPWLVRAASGLLQLARDSWQRKNQTQFGAWTTYSRLITIVASVVLLGWIGGFFGSGKNDKALDAAALSEAVQSEFEMPPVAPLPPLAPDPVAAEFKLARAEYWNARARARQEFSKQLDLRRLEIVKIVENDPEAGDSLRAFDQQSQDYWLGSDGGPLPSHLTMLKATDIYWEAMDDAILALGKVADKGLANYQKLGVTDPVKLNPLRAMSIAAQNYALLDVWTSDNDWRQKFNVCTIMPDENTGTLRVDCSFNCSVIDTPDITHSTDLVIKDGRLTFSSHFLDLKTHEIQPEGRPTAAWRTASTLNLEFQNNDKTMVIHKMRRSGYHAKLDAIRRNGVPLLPIRHPLLAADKADVTSASYVWRKLAALSSAPVYQGGHLVNGPESLYIPTRSKTPNMSGGLLGGFGLFLSPPGSDPVQKSMNAIMGDYQTLFATPFPYLKRAAGDFLHVTIARLKLAEADDQYGNTPSSSIRQFDQNVFSPALQLAFQREADRQELRETVQRQYPNRSVTVLEAPLSSASTDLLHQMISGADGIEGAMKESALISHLLGYADMEQADRTASLWNTWLLPLARRASGAVTQAPLIDLGGRWVNVATIPVNQSTQLDGVNVLNVYNQDLTHVVIELLVENEWGDKSTTCHYLDQLEVGEMIYLTPDPRMRFRCAPFSNKYFVTCSLLSDQASVMEKKITIENTNAIKDTASKRQIFLKDDTTYKGQGEALGAIMRFRSLIPEYADLQRLRLIELASPRSSYALSMNKTAPPYIVTVHQLDAEKGSVELEIKDIKKHADLVKGTPFLRGQLKQIEEIGWALILDSGHSIYLARDDQLVFSTPKTPEFEVGIFPLVRVKLK